MLVSVPRFKDRFARQKINVIQMYIECYYNSTAKVYHGIQFAK